MTVFNASHICKEVSEVGRAVLIEICYYCPWYGNDANPPVKIMLYLKTALWE